MGSKNDSAIIAIGTDAEKFRTLTTEEIDILKQNHNHAEDWKQIRIADPMDFTLIRDSEFSGTIYLESLVPGIIQSDSLPFQVGIYNSLIRSCRIGKNVCIRDVHYLCGYTIGDHSLLFNLGEMTASETAVFGQGFLRENQDPDDRLWIELINENGGRKILPFADMLPADAYLWAKFRADDLLQKEFVNWTDRLEQDETYAIASIGTKSIIRNTRTIENVWIGPHATIDSASRLANLTIRSSAEEPTTIGSGADLRDGIVGFSNAIYSNVIAENFFTGRNVHLKYGVRFINSFLGPNSTISCCEVLSNLLYPFHEQHHNNSFLIATVVMGQANIAAGATIGSNHNSRAADGEIWAERGFWPGLVTNFKHNSSFAAFTLIAKGNYNAELHITLPFTLVSPAENPADIRLFPGFWFKYNMYGLARNTWKFARRDKRKIKQQHIEIDFLAPDTVEEMFSALTILQHALEQAAGRELKADEIIRDALTLDKTYQADLEGMINKGRARLLKPAQGYVLYRMMILFYAIRELLPALTKGSKNSLNENLKVLLAEYRTPARDWLNVGGQIISAKTVRKIRRKIESGTIHSWDDLHLAYDQAHEEYSGHRRQHALFSLLHLLSIPAEELSVTRLLNLLDEFKETTQKLLDWTFASREKDYTATYRKIVYDDADEMTAVLGKIEENPFLTDYKKEMEGYISQVDHLQTLSD